MDARDFFAKDVQEIDDPQQQFVMVTVVPHTRG